MWLVYYYYYYYYYYFILIFLWFACYQPTQECERVSGRERHQFHSKTFTFRPITHYSINPLTCGTLGALFYHCLFSLSNILVIIINYISFERLKPQNASCENHFEIGYCVTMAMVL